MQLDDLDLAFSNTGRLVRGVRPDQWASDTPCREWNLRAVANHTTWVVSMFGEAAHGRPPRSAPDADQLGDDPGAAFDAAAAVALDAWRAHGLEGNLMTPRGERPAGMAFAINVVDTFVHGWDIAQATGQDADLDPTLCAALLEVMPSLEPAFRRGDNFAAALDIAPDAAAPERLLAYLGRKG